jgi:hypothetical protein
MTVRDRAKKVFYPASDPRGRYFRCKISTKAIRGTQDNIYDVAFEACIT